MNLDTIDPSADPEQSDKYVFFRRLSQLEGELLKTLPIGQERTPAELKQIESIAWIVNDAFHNVSWGNIIRKEVEQRGDVVVKPIKPIKNEQRIGRNDLCHCGSGKKFKACCLNT